jgi:hypothetical protein
MLRAKGTNTLEHGRYINALSVEGNMQMQVLFAIITVTIIVNRTGKSSRMPRKKLSRHIDFLRAYG